ncbi:MAG: CvpA family protein [Oscillospiraceae bacterium]|nr:CvpA family protein [Oscillospiraceae bacterium]
MAFNSAIFLDMLIISVFFYFTVISAKRGLVASVVCFGRYIASFYLATRFSRPFAEYIYKIFIKQNLTEFLAEKIRKICGSSLNLGSLKDSVIAIKRNFSVLPHLLNLDRLSKKLDTLTSETSENFPQTVVKTLIHPVIKPIICALLFFIFLRILRIIMRQLVRAAYCVNFIPVLGSFNRVIGAVFGFGEAFIIMFILMNVVIGYYLVPWPDIDKGHLSKYFSFCYWAYPNI